MSRDDELGELVAVLAQEADQVDREAHFPRRGIAALRERGLFGLMVPEEYGGLGGGLAEFTRTAAGLGSGCLSTALIWAMHCQQVDTVVRFGSERLRGEVLPRVARDGLYLASVTTERGKGGHLLSADSALTADGNEIVVDRDAPVVTGGAHADGYLLTARNAPGAAATETTLVYAHRSQVATEETGGWDTLGMRGTESVALRITGRVPDWQVVGPPGGFREVAVESMIPVGHLGWAACWLGAANGAFTGVMNAVRKRDPAIRVNLASDLARERIGRIRVDLELVGAYLDRARAEVESARATAAPWTDRRSRSRSTR